MVLSWGMSCKVMDIIYKEKRKREKILNFAAY